MHVHKSAQISHVGKCLHANFTSVSEEDKKLEVQSKAQLKVSCKLGLGGSLQVFILSVRSGAVGINLTSANYIFMLEPLMNPALDEQAVGRAWRMGQKRPVRVKRLVAKGTIEDTIISLAKKRKV
jgi:hypothetical protein